MSIIIRVKANMSSTLIFLSLLLISVYVSAEDAEASIDDFRVKSQRNGNFWYLTIDIDINSSPNHHFETQLDIILGINPIYGLTREVLDADSNGRVKLSVGANTKELNIVPNKEYEIKVKLYFSRGDPSIKTKTIIFN